MNKIRVIKGFNTARKQIDTYSDDAAVMEFRSFHQVASLHVERVEGEAARSLIREILEDLNDKVIAKAQTML